MHYSQQVDLNPVSSQKKLIVPLKFLLYTFVLPSFLTHPCSMTVTRSLAASESFLGSAKSLVAWTSIGLACGGIKKRERKLHGEKWKLSFLQHFKKQILSGKSFFSDLCHHCVELRKAGPISSTACPAFPHDNVQLLRAIWWFLQTLTLPFHAPQNLHPRQ